MTGGEPVDAGRLRRLLKLTYGDNDAEALLALRRVQRDLAAAGTSLHGITTDAALAATTTNGLTPDCIAGQEEGTLLLRPAPSVVTLHPDLRGWLPRIASAVSAVLRDVCGSAIRIRTEGKGADASVLAETPGNPGIEIWTGPRAEASILAASLRPAIARATRAATKE